MRPRSARIRPRRQIHLSSPERLEDRRLLATFTVVNTDDSGPGSLRQAIVNADGAANPTGDVDRIAFHIPGSGVQTIKPTSDPLPEITDPVSIDGYTQPGAVANTNPVTAADNAVLLIEIDGSGIEASSQAIGLGISAGGSTIRGLAINKFAYNGVLLTGAGGDRIAGNFIGTNAAGTDAKPNNIGMLVGSPDNTIGGTTAEDRNVISGNGNLGIYLYPSVSGSAGGLRTLIEGNFIGTDVSGTVAVPNHNNGVLITRGADTTIGGTALAARNLISGNGPGILATDQRALIQGNLIGTDITGRVALGNGGFGIDVASGIDNTIGGTAAGAGNIISGNNAGIEILEQSTGTVVQGNHIGTDDTGTVALGNGSVGILVKTTSATIGGTAAGAGNVIAFTHTGNATGIEYFSANVPVLHNAIYGNLGAGILFSPGLVPKLTSATPTTIAGTLTGGAVNTTYHLEFFATPDMGNRLDNAQGKTFLGELDVPTDGSGAANFSISPTGGVPAGQFLTATATSPTGTTSNFSAAIQVTASASADVGVSIDDAPDLVAPGGMITETITATNHSPDAAQDVTLTVPVPVGTTFGRFSTADGLSATVPTVGSSGGTVTVTIPTLAAGAAPLVFTLVVTVDGAAADGSTISETASVTSATTDDPDEDNNTSETTTTVRATSPPTPTADVGVTVSDAPDPVAPGGLLTYTITVTNAGPDVASGVGLTDTIPAGTTFVSWTAPGGWTPSTPAVGGTGTVSASTSDPMPAGTSAVFTLVVRVDPGAVGGTSIADTASISSTSDDPDSDDDTDLASTTVQTASMPTTADLAVTQSASPGTATAGTDDVTFTIEVTNHGPDPASHVTLTETLPLGAPFVSATGGATPGEGTLTFALGDLTSGATRTFTIVVRPQSAGTLTASATVSTAEADPSMANNTAVASAVAADPSTSDPPAPSVTPTPESDGSRLIGVRRYGIHAMPTTVVLMFTKPLDPAARQLQHYRITGRHGARIPIRSAVYDPTAYTVTLHPSQRLSIHHPYKLMISGTGSGRPHVGQVTGRPGSDDTIRLTWRQLVLPSGYRPVKAAAARQD